MARVIDGCVVVLVPVLAGAPDVLVPLHGRD